jgi:hypothetical protein
MGPRRKSLTLVATRLGLAATTLTSAARAEPPAAVAPAQATPAPPVDEITVKGQRADPGETTLAGSEVRQIPGAFGDAFRAVDILPGVVPMASGLPYYFIRGAPPGDSAYFIDGVEVPLLFHAAVGPSVIHPALVDRVDFFPGGAPAAYGRFAGGVIAATLPPPATAAHAEGSVRVFDAGALAETPFADGRGTALAAGRYSYSGAILSLVSPIQVAYWDYQARATWKLGEHDEIGVFAFGSHDDFAQVVAGTTDTILDGGFHRVDLRYDHTTPDSALRVAATLGYARSNDDDNDIRDLSAGVRAAYEQRISSTASLRAGGDLRLDRYDLLADSSVSPRIVAETNAIYPPHLDTAAGGYVDLAWRLAPRVEVVPGVRVDLFSSHRYDAASYAGVPGAPETTSTLPALDPRLSTRVDVSPGVSLLSSVAVAHQPAAYLVPVPGLTVVERDPTLQTAFELSQGVAVKLPWDLLLQLTGFLHEYRDLNDLTATCGSVFGSGILLGNAPRIMSDPCVVETVSGQAFGAELLLKRSLTKRLGGWVSYTLSRSTREVLAPGALGLAGATPGTILSSFDRTHTGSLGLSYSLGAGWRAGARFVAYSGLPYTSTRDYVPVAPYDGARMPAFYRLDVRLEKRWRVGDRAAISLVFEGMNVTLTKEVLGEHCAPAPGRGPTALDACTPQTLGPVTVPSIGVEASY